MADSLSSAVQTIAPFMKAAQHTDAVLRHAAAKGQVDEEQSVARGHSRMSKSSCKMATELFVINVTHWMAGSSVSLVVVIRCLLHLDNRDL